MKILLIAGHGAGDPGAPGCGYQEATLTRELVNLIAPKLRKYATVDVYNESRSAFYDVQNGTFNIGRYDYVLEVHFNAFNGKGYGTEIYVTDTEKYTDVEHSIMNKLGKYFTLRGSDRGVKVTNWLVIYTCKCLGISSALLETCFIDNKDDMAKYQANKDSIAQGIVDGIVDGFGLKANDTEQKPANKPVVHKKPTKPSKPAQPDQILNVGEYFMIDGVHRVDQVLPAMDSIWCEEMTGNGGNSIQAGPLTKCDKKGNVTKSQVFSVGDYFKCDKKFKVLAVDVPTNAVQANVGGRKIWLYAGPLREV